MLGFRSLAQDYTISGEVIDSTYKKPLYLANVTLRNQKDSLINASVTDDKGLFLLKKISKGKYQIKVSFVGFKVFTKSISIDNKSVALGQIILAEDITNLDSVSVVGEADAVVMKKDTIEFNSSAFKTTDEANLDELLKKMPGMEVKDGKVKAQGKEITKIIVDGKPFFENSPEFALKNIPANMVKKVQIIDEKSKEAQFTGHDDGERTKVLNIVTKPEKRKGHFGRTSLTYSHPNRYNANANINFIRGKDRFSFTGSYNNLGSGGGERVYFSEGMSIPVNLNGSFQGGGGISENKAFNTYYYSEVSKKLEITFSYRYNDSNSKSIRDISRQFIQTVDEGRIYNEKSENSSSSYNHNGSIRITYKPSKNDEIWFSHSQSKSNSTSFSKLDGATLLNNELLNSTDNFNFSENTNNSWNNNLTWRHKFKKKGRTISLKTSNSIGKGTGIDTVRSTNIFTSGDIENQIFDQISDPDNSNRKHVGEISYTEPLGEKSSLRLSYNGTLSINDQQRLLLDFNESDNAYSDLDAQRSSQYKLSNFNNKLYAGVRFKIKKLDLSIRSNFQHVTIENEQVYPNIVDTKNTFKGILPSISLSKNNGGGERAEGVAKQSRITVSRSMQTPAATQLQDVINNRNPLFISQGNPNLAASFSNSVSLNHFMYNEKTYEFVQASLSASFTDNAIVNSTIVGNGSNSPSDIQLPIGARFTKPVNIGGRKSLNASISLSKPIKAKKIHFNTSASVSYSKSPQLLNNIRQIAESFNYGFSLGLSSNFNEKLDMSISSRPSYSVVNNSNQEQSDRKYFAISNSFNTTWKFTEGFSVNTSLSHRVQGSVQGIPGTSQWIWNMSLSRKFFKKKLDFRISATDILRQNAVINRNITSEYIQNSETNVLRQIFRFSLSYKFNKMGGGKKGG